MVSKRIIAKIQVQQERVFPRKKLLCLFVLCLSLLCVSAAHGQTYVYTFYDGWNATGNVMATYTGPLISSALNNTPTSGFVVSPANTNGVFSFASQMQVCSWLFQPGIASCFTANHRFSIESFQALPTGPGLYDMNQYTVLFQELNGFTIAFVTSFTITPAPNGA